MGKPGRRTPGPGKNVEEAWVGECVCVCVCGASSGVWCGCVRVSVGRQFQGSLIHCPLTPDVRYVHSGAYRHRMPLDPGF